MQGMFWVLVLTVLLLYVCAILAVVLIEKGHLGTQRRVGRLRILGVPPVHESCSARLIFSDDGVPANIKGIFSGVFEAMFILFLVMNGEFDAVEEILDTIPATQMACALFMIISNWAILAIFTAVVSENMITTVEDRRRENEEARDA